MIKRFPIKPIQLAFLLVLLYFAVFSREIAVLVLSVFVLLCLFRHYERKQVFQTLCCLAVFGVYFFCLQVKQEKDDASEPAQLTEVQIIPDTLTINGDLLAFEGKSAGRTYQVYYTLQSQEEQRYFQKLSDTVILTVQATTDQATPQRNFGGFDYRAYLKNKGIYRTASIEVVKNVRVAGSLTFLERLHEWRRRAIVHIQTHFPAPMQHYMTGLLFGYLDNSFDEMSDIYSSLGIIHLFALSGMQVGFFIGLFRFLFLRMGWRRDFVDYLQIPFSLCYAGLTGFSVSVVRSLVQSSFTNLGIKRLDNFALTLMILFVLMPNFLLTTGGVLSFAYAFILSLTDFSDLPKYRRLLAETFSLSLGVLPFLIYFFSTFQPMSIVLTAVFSLAFDVVMLPLLSVIFVLSPVLQLTAVNPLFEWLEAVVTWSGNLFSHPLVFGKPNLLVLLALLIVSGLLYDFYGKKKLALILSICLALLFFITKHPLTNEVTVVDVGQGDSIFLRDRTGKTVLIDVGGKVTFGSGETWQTRVSDANAERTLIPYLKSRGVGKIDQLVLTHTDTDHIGDLEVMAKEFTIGEVLVSPGSLTVPDFVARLKAMKVKVRVVQAGEKLTIMGSHLQVLYPFETGDGGNNDSLVLYGQLLNKTFLFTGDLGKEGEEILIARYPQLPVDVLKAGHHGSKGSSSEAFLDHIHPQIALLSAGANNRYKHPHDETLERFNQRGIAYLRTDQSGAIRMSGWRTWRIETVR